MEVWLRRLATVIVAVVFCGPLLVGLGRNDLAGDKAAHADYQMPQPDRGLWQVMLGSHVYQRFSGHLDVAHLRPWHYYFTDLLAQATAADVVLLVPGPYARCGM